MINPFKFVLQTVIWFGNRNFTVVKEKQFKIEVVQMNTGIFALFRAGLPVPFVSSNPSLSLIEYACTS